MRTMIGIKLKKSPTMCITVSIKLAEFHPNPHQCTHTSRKRPFLTATLPSDNHKSYEESYDLGGKHSAKISLHTCQEVPIPTCRLWVEF